MTNKIYYGKQSINNKDLKAVNNSLKKRMITNGSYVERFENLCKSKLKAKFAITCNSGTSALFLAFLAIGLKKNDVVIMPAVNFIASANMAKVSGAKIYFADIDYNTGQINPQSIIDCLKKNKIKKVKAIISMYMGGYPRFIKDLYRLKKKLNCYLIEDACHAFGASYEINKKKFTIGSCLHSDICTFSFHPLKTITTGEGGLITTNKRSMANKIRLYRSHNIQRKNFYWNYSINNVGFNFRLSDINCALGYSQLKRLNYFITKRKKIYDIYKNEFSSENHIKIIDSEKKTNSSYHLVIAWVNFERLRMNKSTFFKKLVKKNIFCQFHYIPIFNFKNFKVKNKYNFKNSNLYYKNAFSLPIYPDLKIKSVYKVIHEIKKLIKN